jgi:hypothetical protein
MLMSRIVACRVNADYQQRFTGGAAEDISGHRCRMPGRWRRSQPNGPGEPGVAAARRREGLFDLKPTRLSLRGGNGLPRGGGV